MKAVHRDQGFYNGLVFAERDLKFVRFVLIRFRTMLIPYLLYKKTTQCTFVCVILFDNTPSVRTEATGSLVNKVKNSAGKQKLEIIIIIYFVFFFGCVA